MRPLSGLPLALLGLILVAAGSPECPAADGVLPPAKAVEVVNFPDPQNVTGSVEVSNLPETQDVFVTNTPLLVTTEPSGRFQLVGFTDSIFTGDQGVLGFTLACQAQFPGSRMCTSVEVMETLDVPPSLEGLAWVRPVYVPAVARDIDASGENAESCDGWKGGGSGLSVDSEGRFSTRSCSFFVSAACCAPAPSAGR